MKEIWRDIPGYEGLYKINTKGDIITFSYKRKRPLSQIIGTTGYFMADLNKNNIKKKKRVHRLVAMAFIPNPENKPCVNHIDGDKLNNNVENLEWCTYSENSYHSYRVLERQAPRGTEHSSSKLTDEHVRNIRLLYKRGGISQKKLGVYYGVSAMTIWNIIKNKKWAHV